jgi:hypothetical protein
MRGEGDLRVRVRRKQIEITMEEAGDDRSSSRRVGPSHRRDDHHQYDDNDGGGQNATANDDLRRARAPGALPPPHPGGGADYSSTKEPAELDPKRSLALLSNSLFQAVDLSSYPSEMHPDEEEEAPSQPEAPGVHATEDPSPMMMPGVGMNPEREPQAPPRVAPAASPPARNASRSSDATPPSGVTHDESVPSVALRSNDSHSAATGVTQSTGMPTSGGGDRKIVAAAAGPQQPPPLPPPSSRRTIGMPALATNGSSPSTITSNPAGISDGGRPSGAAHQARLDPAVAGNTTGPSCRLPLDSLALGKRHDASAGSDGGNTELAPLENDVLFCSGGECARARPCACACSRLPRRR